MTAKSYRFFLHFNRNNMQQGNPMVWTVHFRGVCYPATNIKVMVPMETRYLPHGRQPRATFRGSAHKLITQDDGTVLLV